MDKLTTRALAYAERYARGWCQDFDVPEHARDDAIQEARLEALKRARTYNEDKGQMLEEWVRTRLEPRLFRWLQRLHHGGITGTSETQAPIGVFNATVEEPQDSAGHEDVEKLLGAVDDLDEEDRQFLHYVYGTDGVHRTHAGVAAELGVTRQAITARIARIVKKIYQAVAKTDFAGNPYRGDEAQTESPSTEDSAALRGGAIEPSYASTEYKHLKKQFRDLCEATGYPSSAAPTKHGLHDEQTGPGTLSTKCCEWVTDGKFWTDPRKKLRKEAAIRFANERREFRLANTQEAERLMAAGQEMAEIPGGQDASEFFFRQAVRSPRYSGLLLGSLESVDTGTEE